MGRSFKVVILGGGTAAGYAALEFVKYGINHGELCIISDESVAPYERPALSKGFLLPQGNVRLPSFHTCIGTGQENLLPKWYKDHGIELVLDTRVVAADVRQKTLLTASQETITYQTLIIATGARALGLENFGVAPAVAKNICYLRDLKDATKLVQVMTASRCGKAVVIGGGYIGMECAAALVSNQISVTMVFPESHCMARLFTPEIASFYEDYYKKKGVAFMKGKVMSAFERDEQGKVVAILLEDGSKIPADLVVVGVGIIPNIELFEGQLVIEKGGIKVNGKMRTSNNSVYAVGDVATFLLKMYGITKKVEHVDHARRSAAHAVQSIMAPEKAQDYDYLPFFYSRVFSLSWQFFGENVGECVLFGEPANGKFGAYWIDKGHLVGAFLEGGGKDEYAALARVTRERIAIKSMSALKSQGIEFALAAPYPTGQGSLTGFLEGNAHFLLSKPSPLVLHASACVAVAVAVGAFAYWVGKRRKR